MAVVAVRSHAAVEREREREREREMGAGECGYMGWGY